MNRLVMAWLLILTVGALGGCGGGDSSAGSGGSGGAIAAGETGGKGVQSAAGHGGAGGASTSVMCGSATCDVSPAAAAFASACCADAAQSTCGTSMAGGACMPVAKSDPRCPAVDVMGFISLPSCCTGAGQCGIDSSMFGIPGCTDLASAASQANSAAGGISIPIPSPRPCDGADAGM